MPFPRLSRKVFTRLAAVSLRVTAILQPYDFNKLKGGSARRSQTN
ncbi:Uncharacterised protein [Vibrio cholerae]|nr:Uncharacterised protein [Vibrio cholerae]